MQKLIRPRSNEEIKDHKYPETRKKSTLVWTDEMNKFIEENAHKHTYKELATIMNVPEKSLRTKCRDLGFKCKGLSVKYNFYENDILVATGFIPEIARLTGINDTTLRNYVKGKRKTVKRRMEKINES